MKPDKHGFDEMQKARRDKIGHQAFNLLLYLLLIDVALNSFGARWLEYPSNIMVIVMASSSVYVIRMIAADAFMPVKSAQMPKAGKRMMIGIAATILVAAGLAVVLSNFNVFPATEGSGDNSGLVLMIVSVLGLIVSAVFALIKRINDKNDNGNE